MSDSSNAYRDRSRINHRPASRRRTPSRGSRVESLEGRTLLSAVLGDFNRDGYADLAVGSSGEKVGNAPGAGAVNVLYGSAKGLAAAGNQLWTQGDTGKAASERGDRFGAALGAGDFDG